MDKKNLTRYEEKLGACLDGVGQNIEKGDYCLLSTSNGLELRIVTYVNVSTYMGSNFYILEVDNPLESPDNNNTGQPNSENLLILKGLKDPNKYKEFTISKLK